jgi:hypothetical protein
LTWLFIRKLHDGPAFKPAGKSLEKASVIEQQPPALPQKPADTVHEQRGILTNPAKKVMRAADQNLIAHGHALSLHQRACTCGH